MLSVLLKAVGLLFTPKWAAQVRQSLLVTLRTSNRSKAGQDFFPLTGDYQEKTFAAGQIPGGFFQRETYRRYLLPPFVALVDHIPAPGSPAWMATRTLRSRAGSIPSAWASSARCRA